jgi:hypothetical protein
VKPATARTHQKASIFDRRYLREGVELGLVALAFLLYFVVRANVVDHADQALSHSRDLLHLERSLGIDVEQTWQEWTLKSRVAVRFFNFVYFWLDFPLIAAVGLVTYARRRRQYTFARDAILFSGALALVVYSLYPVTPPRLLPETGLVDTLQQFNSLSYQAQSTSFFVNPYAALPSLHVGWSFLLAIGVIWAFGRNRLVAALAIAHPLTQWISTMVTGNHYLIDGFGGLAVACGGLGYALLMDRVGYAAIRRRMEPTTV